MKMRMSEVVGSHETDKAIAEPMTDREDHARGAKNLAGSERRAHRQAG